MDCVKKIWSWIGTEHNHNAITVIITCMALVFAFPYFSNQINNIQIRVDSLQASIDGIYGKYKLEIFCYDELKDSFKDVVGGKIVSIRLKQRPVPNSVNVWEGAMNISPLYFKVNDNVVEVETNFSVENLKEICSTPGSNGNGFKYTVMYIPTF